jgi:hypothetical protein
MGSRHQTPPFFERTVSFHKTLGVRPMRGAVERFLQDRITGQLLE